MNIAKALIALNSTSAGHGGSEVLLQNIIASSQAAAAGPPYSFSPNMPRQINGGISSTAHAWGVELGFIRRNPSSGNMFIDIALATSGGAGSNPTRIDKLCEVKIFNPIASPQKGRYYPWVYHYDCSPPQYNFLQCDSNGDHFISNADEGQIFFDIIKMLHCAEIVSFPKSKPSIYQLIVIKEQRYTGEKVSFEYALKALGKIFEAFNQNVGILEVYDWTSLYPYKKSLPMVKSAITPMIKCIEDYELTGSVLCKAGQSLSSIPNDGGLPSYFYRMEI